MLKRTERAKAMGNTEGQQTASTERTTVKRRAARGRYDRATIYSILDEGLVCHVGFVADGQPYVIPTGYARAGGRLYLHGSAASRMLNALSAAIDISVTVTILDG